MDKVDKSHQEEMQSLKASNLAGQIDPSILPDIQFCSTGGTEPKSWHEFGGDNTYWDFFKRIMKLRSTRNDELCSSLRQRFLDLPFHEQLAAFELSQQLTHGQRRTRWQIAVDVLSVIRNNTEHKNCDAIVFGSLATGLSTPVSDIDISLDLDEDNGEDLDDSKLMEERRKDISAFQRLLMSVLSKALCPYNPAKRLFSTVRLSGTKGKSICVQHAQTGIWMDLVFHNQVGILYTKLLQFYMNFEPRTKQLIVFLAYWTQFHRISGYTKLTKLSMKIMILVFLMEKKMIPSVLLLQTVAACQRLQRGEMDYHETPDSYFCDDPELIKNYFTPAVVNSSINTPEEDAKIFFDLLADFFSTVVNTRFSTSVVSPYLGKIVRNEDVLRTATECIHALPTEVGVSWKIMYPKYFESKHKFYHDAAIYIQDPFALNVNTALKCERIDRDEFVVAAKHTLSILRKNVFTFLELFQVPCNSELEELLEIVKHSESKQYFKMLLGKCMKSESEEEQIFKENTGSEILPAIQDISWVPKGMFEDLEQFDASFLKGSWDFLDCYMVELYKWKILGGSEYLSSWELKWQITALWGMFATQSLQDCFTKALNPAEERVTMNEVDQDCPIAFADRYTYEDAFTLERVECYRKALYKIAPPQHVQKGRQRIATLSIPGRSIKYGVIEVKVTYPFWRRKNRNVKNRNAAVEEKISLEIYKDHLSKTTEKGEGEDGKAADFIPFFIYVLYKLDARADLESQVCAIPKITFLVQEFNEKDVPRDVCLERVLARKSVMDILQRTFESYQLDRLTKWLNA